MRPPHEGAARTPDVEGESGNSATSSAALRKSQTAFLRRDPRFHRLCERLHGLGPRPLGEWLLEVAEGRDLLELLEEYSRFDPFSVARLGGRDWRDQTWLVSA
jgi:hypothetical protein